MLQRVLHEGSTVHSGIKYALRCDILYKVFNYTFFSIFLLFFKRVSGDITEIMKELDNRQQAQRWYQLASAMELSGLASESIPYYKKANKLDPEILYG